MAKISNPATVIEKKQERWIGKRKSGGIEGPSEGVFRELSLPETLLRSDSQNYSSFLKEAFGSAPNAKHEMLLCCQETQLELSS